MSKFKTVLLSLVLVLTIGLMSCRSLLEEFMPVNINKRAVEYSEIDPEELKPYPTLADAKRVKIEIIVNHRDKQISLKRQAEDDNLAHSDAYGFINQDIMAGDANLDLLIGSKGNPFSVMGMLFSLGVGGGGLALGRRFLKRPGDFTPQEHEVEIVKAKNGNA
jgi:hypothetical protein